MSLFKYLRTLIVNKSGILTIPGTVKKKIKTYKKTERDMKRPKAKFYLRR